MREAELLLASGLRTEAEMAFRSLEAEPTLAARATRPMGKPSR